MKFKRATDQGSIEVDGEPITINGRKCFIYQETIEDKWGVYTFFLVIDHASGCKISSGLFKETALDKAKENLESTSEHELNKIAKAMVRSYNIKYPVNP